MWKFFGLQLDSKPLLIPAVLMLLLHTNGCTGLASKSGGLTTSTAPISSAGSAAPTSSVVPYKGHFSHISLYFPNWNIANVQPTSLQSQIMQFVADRFDIISGGSLDPRSWNAYTAWAVYIEHAAEYVTSWEGYMNEASTLGFSDPEGIALHSNIDYAAPGSVNWLYTDGFDVFDQPGNGGVGSYTSFRNGVFLVDSGNNYTDKSVAAYDRNSSDVAINNVILIGYSEKFDEINFLLATPASGCSVQWSYWNGVSYAALTLTSDGTSGLTQTGRINFAPPTNWNVKSENGSATKYWVKGTVSGCIALPVASRIYGASWYRVALANNRVLGGDAPFGAIHVELAVPASGLIVTWQYWNGAWRPLNLASDATHGLTQSGQITFTPPPDWIPSSPSSADANKYYLRVQLSGTGVTPVASTVKDDLYWNLYADSFTDLGYLASDPHASNGYNPIPPAGSSARWRYQSRVTGTWAHDMIFGNPSYVENGNYAWGKINIYLIQQAKLTNNYDGVLFDSGGDAPAFVQQANLDVRQDQTWSQLENTLYDFERTTLHNLYSSPGFAVGSNASNYSFSVHGDWVGNENAYFSFVGPPQYSANGDWSFDGYLAVNNPQGTKAYGMCMDQVRQLTPGFVTNSWFYWDQGNRTPILCLAQYYIGANQNTGFSYNTDGFFYVDSDDYYYYSAPAQTTGSVAIGSGATFNVTGGIPVGWTSGTIRLGDPSATSGDKFSVSVSGNTMSTSATIYNSYSAGTNVYFVLHSHQSTDPVPTASNVDHWGFWFPAMGVNVGAPAGNRNEHWLTGPNISGQPNAATTCQHSSYVCPDILRRDYANAIMLARPNIGVARGMIETELITPSQVFCIQDGSTPPCASTTLYYPLRADGRTGAGVTSFQLQAGEGAILMKNPTP